MNKASRLGAAALAAGLVLTCADARLSGAARAQAVDQRALEELDPAPNQARAPATAKRPPGHKSAPHHARYVATGPHAHPNGPHQSLPELATNTPAQPPPPPAKIPPAPPPGPVLPPPIVVPTRPVELPPPPIVTDAAAGHATRAGETLRVTFGVGSADLNPQDESAVRGLVQDPKPPPASHFTITGYAVGTPDDPSTARRLSLSRALAVRSVLMHAGIPSEDIFVRALGAAPPDPSAPPDRVDVAVLPAQAAANPPPGNAKAATQ
jgi:outer membrane protein OmpA-like peptidoglycan-associated protein